MKVGIMDSGAGGISILNRIQEQYPYLELHYLADSGFAPYGDKSQDELEFRLIAIGRYFESVGAKAIVVACNTATVAGIDALRANTALPVIGVEPAIKPACNGMSNKRVAVLATPFTAQSPRLQQLVALWRSDCEVRILGHATLAKAIDARSNSPKEVEKIVAEICNELNVFKIDALVLACTHYPLVKTLFEKHLSKNCDIVEPSMGVSAQLVRRLQETYPNEMARCKEKAQRTNMRIESTGDQCDLNALLSWFDEKDHISESGLIRLN